MPLDPPPAPAPALPAALDPAAAAAPLDLTPLRAHYLKKELLRRAVSDELSALARPDALALLGPPFRPLSAGAPPPSTRDLPILRFVFHQFVLTFPLLRNAPPSFYSNKIQVFAEQLLARNLSSSDDREADTKRHRLALRLQRYFVLLLSSAIATTPPEQVVHFSPADAQRLAVSEVRAADGASRGGQPLFEVNIIAVRLVYQRGLMTRSHEQFLVRTRRGRFPDCIEETIVARRHGDFGRLADTLRAQFPENDVPSPPAKDHTHVRVPEDDGDPAPPGSMPGSGGRVPLDAMEPEPVKLSREKNRLTLRAYLRTLLSSPDLADSATMRVFLMNEPTELTLDEARDAAAREALDLARQTEAARFATETTARVEALQSYLSAFKADLVQPDGLARVFATIKRVPRISQLPPSYRAVVAWGRISAASSLFHMFRRSDRSSELLSQLKRIHSMMPYRILRGILKISNPVAMIRAGLDLFLAQPFGQKSLVQRMFLSGISEELRELNHVQDAIEEKIADPDLAQRVYTYVSLQPAEQDTIRGQAEKPGWDLMSAILRSRLCGPPLTREQVPRCSRAAASHARYMCYRQHLAAHGNLDEDPGPPDDAAWLFEDLHVLLRMALRARDKEQMLALLSEEVTANLLKDVVTILYAPLAQVYKAANIADSLGDLQAFISDLISTVDGLDQVNFPDAAPGSAGAQHTVQVFVDLVARHEQAFYTFVYNVHSRGAGLFDGLMDWLQRFINLVRGPEVASAEGEHPNTEQVQPPTRGGGLGTLDLEILLPVAPAQRAALLAEADKLVAHAYQTKMARELRVRRKLARQKMATEADQLLAGLRAPAGNEEEWSTADDAAFSGEVMKHLGFSGNVRDEVVEATLDGVADSGESSDSEESFDDEEEYSLPLDRETIVDAWGNRNVPVPPPQRGTERTGPPGDPPAPELTAIPELVPMFIELVRPLACPLTRE